MKSVAAYHVREHKLALAVADLLTEWGYDCVVRHNAVDPDKAWIIETDFPDLVPVKHAESVVF